MASPEDIVYWEYSPTRPQNVLFERLSGQLDGFSVDDVIGTALLMFANGIKQRYPEKENALHAYDQLMQRGRNRLVEVIEGQNE